MDTVKAELFGQDPKVTSAISTARNLAVTRAPILIIGDKGIGKKSLARFIHDNSSRNGKEFVVVDCARTPNEVANQVLGFRDEINGKFTRGALEAGNGGTVVFSDIDNIDEEFQKRLCKILGELDDYDINIRLIATTTKNLSKLVGSGRFFRGLYMKVSDNQIVMPSIKERPGDVEYLAREVLKEFSVKYSKNFTMDQEAIEKLLSYQWEQNTQQIFAVLEKAALSVEGEAIFAEDLVVSDNGATASMMEDSGDGLKLMSLKDAEKLLIRKALAHTAENRTQAAKILGVSIRTLRNKINEYRVEGDSYFVNLR